jgi:tellurite resistance protein TehA-like permease
MAADFYSILDNFKNFIGGRTGLFHWCLFCLAVVMLFFLGRKYQEEKQTVRFLVWPTILVLLFLFNPLFYRYVGSRFFAGVYWRLFWMLPVSFTAGLAGVPVEKTGSPYRCACGGPWYDRIKRTENLQ